MNKIDAHAHIGEYGGIFNVGITPEKFIELMDEYGFERAIITSLDNEEVREAMEIYPNRFIGNVWVNPNEGDKSVETVHKYVRDFGFKGIKLHPLLQSYVANSEIVKPIIESAEELNVPVFIHSGHPPFSLPWSIAQLAEEFPKVNIVMIHMGHGHAVYIQAAIDMAKKLPNLFLETSGMPMHDKIKEAYEAVGGRRIFFGTDIPFHHPSVEIRRAEVSGLDKGQLSNLFYKNIRRLIKF